MSDATTPSESTQDEEAEEAGHDHSAGRGPTDEEERAADSNQLDPDVAAANKDAIERGAGVEGEGKPGV